MEDQQSSARTGKLTAFFRTRKHKLVNLTIKQSREYAFTVQIIESNHAG